MGWKSYNNQEKSLKNPKTFCHQLPNIDQPIRITAAECDHFEAI